MKSVFPNLGFVLQTTGLATLLAAPVAVVYNEQGPLVSILLTAVAFFATGFLMNAFSRRRAMDFRSSCVLIALVYLLLGILGSIPYVYTNAFSDVTWGARLTNAIFESISGYTTTGFSVATNLDSFPRSIVFYRSFTQWIGGINLVFVLLVFFYSERILGELGRAVGLNHVTSTLRRSYNRVFLIYTGYTLLFFGVFFALGLRDPINNISLVFSGLSTGGFSPVDDFSSLVSFPVYVPLIILMVVGATSFSIHYGLFSRRFEKVILVEFLTMVIAISVFAVGLSVPTEFSIPDAFFHVASASSTTGFSFIDFGALTESVKMLFIILMFVGGSAFSTAGGVKFIKVLVFFASIPWVVRGAIKGQLGQFTFQGKDFDPADVLAWWLVLLLGGFVILLSALIFSLSGFPLIDSFFETTSAFSTVGISTGIAGAALPSGLKILLGLVMLVGRVEIITILVAFSRPMNTVRSNHQSPVPTPDSPP